VGPLPPPQNGMTHMTRNVLRSSVGADLVHMDTSDHRHVSNIGRIDITNVLLGVRHVLRFAVMVFTGSIDAAYIPVAQNRLGYLRDALMIMTAAVAGKRIIVHLHGGGFRRFLEESDPLTRWAIRSTMRRVSAVIVLAECLRGNFAGLVPPYRVYAVPNGIDPAQARPATWPIKRKSEQMSVVHLSTLMSEKGSLDFLEAALRIANRRTDARFFLAGPWRRASEEEQARARIAATGLDDRVVLTGEVTGTEKQALLSEASLFVMPTYYPSEGQPLVILEALAAGVPVVASRWAGIPETISEGVNGRLVFPRDVDGLVATIEALLDDDAERDRLARGAIESFEQRFTLRAFSAALSAVFEHVLAEPPLVPEAQGDGSRCAG
jgi:glycosyltransferase involved in cell wall biosynthesis